MTAQQTAQQLHGQAEGQLQERRQVRVWFGDTVICRKVGNKAFAARFEQAMRRRFASLRVTNDPLPPRENPPSNRPEENR